MGPIENAVKQWLSHNEWAQSDTEAGPMVAQLQALAITQDSELRERGQVKAATASAFRAAFAWLHDYDDQRRGPGLDDGLVSDLLRPD